MDKIALRQHSTAEFNAQSYNSVLLKVEQAINRAADGYLFPVTSVTAAYTQNINDAVILCNATGGAFSVTLQPAYNCEQKIITIKKTDASANAVTIDGYGAETIDGAATKSLATQYKSFTLTAKGGAWYIIGAI